MNLFELLNQFPDDDACRQHMERVRWPNGITCPRCKGSKIVRVRTRKQFTCKSKDCRYRFSVTTDTIFHASKIGLRKWFAAMYIIQNAKKSVSSLQLSRELGISEECCWHMCMRIREAMREEPGLPFGGVCQIDDYYHGGEPRVGSYGHAKRGRGTSKQPIVGAIENKTGRLRTAIIRNASGDEIAKAVSGWLKTSGVELHSDKWLGYRKLGQMCKLHRTVDHGIEYVSSEGAHCNAVENAWSLFTRSVIGSFHKISVKHLARYLAEFDSRYNARRENSSFFPRILKQCDGRRLPMKELVAG